MSRVIVDQNNRALLNQYKWFIKSNGYVTAKIKGKFILLHRLVMKAKEGEEIDHINKNKLDNRRSNLRFSDRVKNMRNATYRPGESGLVGVSFHSQNNNWVARIRLNGKRKHLGSFSTKEEAHKTYQLALQSCQT